MDRYVQGRRKSGAVSVLAAVTVLCWAAWMGWDVTDDVDATGQPSGPYEPWQVIGCVLCLLVAAIAARRWLPAAETAWTVTFAFTLAFSISALTLDGHHPYMLLGTIPVFFGTFAGGALVSSAAGYLWRQRRRDDDPVVR